MLAIATNDAFVEAVDMLRPFIGKTGGWPHAIQDLQESDHPDRHARSSLDLLDSLVEPQRAWFLTELRGVLDRVAAAEPDLRGEPGFRSLDEWLRTAE